VFLTTSNQEIKIKSESDFIKNVAVYNILGRLLFEKDNINNPQFSILNTASTQQGLIVKIVLGNNQTVTRKIILYNNVFLVLFYRFFSLLKKQKTDSQKQISVSSLK
jgi:hypothetical protein